MIESTSRVLVTGGAGFIGSHLVERLVSLGHEVRVVDDLSTGHERNIAHLSPHIEFRKGDIRDGATCEQAVDGVDTVFHVAALPSVPRSLADPWASHDVNVNGTVKLLIACRGAGVRRVVYSSSSSVYGDTPTLPKEESAEPLPRSPYAAAKLAAEQYVLAFARAGIVEGVALRYFNVFGPRQDPDSAYAAVIPAFLNAAIGDEAVTIFGDGRQTRDFTYVTNVVDANLAAAGAETGRANGHPMNVGAGHRTSLLELLELVQDVTDRAVEPRFGPPREGDVRDSLASLERASSLIGYTPTVNVLDGLRHTWDWFHETRDSVVAPDPGGRVRIN